MVWRLNVELRYVHVVSSLPRNNMVPGVKKITVSLLNYFYSVLIPGGKSVNICAKTVAEPVRAKSSDIDIVR